MSSTEPENEPVAPAPRWPIERIFLWTVLAGVAIWHRGPGFIEHLRPEAGQICDFFQEWASARNYRSGMPIYTNQLEALERHTGMKANRKEKMLPYNAHPPASVLLALPFTGMDYPEAQFAWNVANFPLLAISILLILCGLQMPFRIWTLLPATVIFLYAFPLMNQIQQGQLNLVLLFLITLAWYFDQNNRPLLAGGFLGAAAAIKLFPAYLFLYFLMRGNWKAIAAGAASFLAVNGLALALFGSQAFVDYVQMVVPSLQHFQSCWSNFSLFGFWLRVFNPDPRECVVPLVHSSLLGTIAAYGSAALVTVIVGWACWKKRASRNSDWSFALCIVGMALVGPLFWNHSQLLFCLPLALLWRDSRGVERWFFRLVFLLMFIPPTFIYLAGMGKEVAKAHDQVFKELPPVSPLQNFLVVSLWGYSIMILFVLVIRATMRSGNDRCENSKPMPLAAIDQGLAHG